VQQNPPAMNQALPGTMNCEFLVVEESMADGSCTDQNGERRTLFCEAENLLDDRLMIQHLDTRITD